MYVVGCVIQKRLTQNFKVWSSDCFNHIDQPLHFDGDKSNNFLESKYTN